MARPGSLSPSVRKSLTSLFLFFSTTSAVLAVAVLAPDQGGATEGYIWVYAKWCLFSVLAESALRSHVVEAFAQNASPWARRRVVKMINILGFMVKLWMVAY